MIVHAIENYNNVSFKGMFASIKARGARFESTTRKRIHELNF